MHEEINRIRAIVHSGQLSQCTEDQLKRMVEVINHYDAANQHHMTEGLREPVQAELERVRDERYHNDAKSERNRLQKEIMQDVKGMFAASKEDGDKKHAESLSTSKEANVLSKKAIKVAWIAVWVAVGGVAIAVIFGIAHSDSKRSANSAAGDTPQERGPALSEKPPLQSPMPQTELPKPLPILTNAVPTNTAQKK